MLIARECAFVRPGGLLRDGVVLVDADDVRLHSCRLAEGLEVKEFDRAGYQDHDADGGKEDERAVERPNRVVRVGAHRRQFIQASRAGDPGVALAFLAVGKQRVAVSVAFMAYGAVSGSWVPRLPAIKEHLGLSDGQVGLALLAAAVGAIIGAAGARLSLIHI